MACTSSGGCPWSSARLARSSSEPAAAPLSSLRSASYRRLRCLRLRRRSNALTSSSSAGPKDGSSEYARRCALSASVSRPPTLASARPSSCSSAAVFAGGVESLTPSSSVSSHSTRHGGLKTSASARLGMRDVGGGAGTLAGGRPVRRAPSGAGAPADAAGPAPAGKGRGGGAGRGAPGGPGGAGGRGTAPAPSGRGRAAAAAAAVAAAPAGRRQARAARAGSAEQEEVWATAVAVERQSSIERQWPRRPPAVCASARRSCADRCGGNCTTSANGGGRFLGLRVERGGHGVGADSGCCSGCGSG
jgi:hypothetical protein